MVEMKWNKNSMRNIVNVKLRGIQLFQSQLLSLVYGSGTGKGKINTNRRSNIF